VAELVGNKAIESAAIEWVMALERKAGREPRDARYERGPADIDQVTPWPVLARMPSVTVTQPLLHDVL
jgi:hypothetical protein